MSYLTHTPVKKQLSKIVTPKSGAKANKTKPSSSAGMFDFAKLMPKEIISQVFGFVDGLDAGELIACSKFCRGVAMDPSSGAWRWLVHRLGLETMPAGMDVWQVAKQFFLWRGNCTCTLAGTLSSLCTRQIIAADIILREATRTTLATITAQDAIRTVYFKSEAEVEDESDFDDDDDNRLSIPTDDDALMDLPGRYAVEPEQHIDDLGQICVKLTASFIIRGMQFTLTSRSAANQSCHCFGGYEAGTISMTNTRRRRCKSQKSVIYVSWTGNFGDDNNHNGPNPFDAENHFEPLIITRPPNYIDIYAAVARVIKVPVGLLDRLVIAGLAGPLRFCGPPNELAFSDFGERLAYLCVNLGIAMVQ